VGRVLHEAGGLGGNILATFREHSENIQRTFREYSVSIQGTFREHSAGSGSGQSTERSGRKILRNCLIKQSYLRGIYGFSYGSKIV
jgi:hypothetical protein